MQERLHRSPIRVLGNKASYANVALSGTNFPCPVSTVTQPLGETVLPTLAEALEAVSGLRINGHNGHDCRNSQCKCPDESFHSYKCAKKNPDCHLYVWRLYGADGR